MPQGLDGPVAVGGLGDEAAGGGDFFADGGDRIGGTGGHRGVGGVEHFEIVVAVADGKASGVC